MSTDSCYYSRTWLEGTWNTSTTTNTTGIPLIPAYILDSSCPSCPIVAAGFYAPNVSFPADNRTTLPVQCPPSPSCTHERNQGRVCLEPQGPFEPVICPPGFYCPDWKAKISCPTGYYCPTGSASPIVCSIFDTCPAGSITPASFCNVMLAGIYDIALVIGFLVFRRYYSKSWRRSTTPHAESSWKHKKHMSVLLTRLRTVVTTFGHKYYPTAQDRRQSTPSPLSPLPSSASEILQSNNSPQVDSQSRQRNMKRGSCASLSGNLPTADKSCISIEMKPVDESKRIEGAAILSKFLHRASHHKPVHMNISFKNVVIKSGHDHDARTFIEKEDAAKNTENSDQVPDLSLRNHLPDGVTGILRSGRFTAILGPVKSDPRVPGLAFRFLSQICGQDQPTSGKIFVSGHHVQRGIGQYKGVIACVPEELAIRRNQTVRQVVLFSARIRLPRTWSDTDVQEYVDAILLFLGLDSIAHLIIGAPGSRWVTGLRDDDNDPQITSRNWSLTPLELRKLNVAIELAAAPLTLLLNDPLSGLTANGSIEMAGLLKRLAALGMTVAAGFSYRCYAKVFDEIDDLWIITGNGRTAYMGPTARIIPYFEHLGYLFRGMGTRSVADLLYSIFNENHKQHEANIQDIIRSLEANWARESDGRGPSNVSDPPISDDPDHGMSSGGDFPSGVSGDTLLYQSHRRAKSPVAGSLSSSTESLPPGNGMSSDSSYSLDLSDLPGAERPELGVDAHMGEMNLHEMWEAMVAERGAGFFRQLILCHNRHVSQQLADYRTFLAEIFLSVFAAVVVGGLSGSGEQYRGMYIWPYSVLSPAAAEYIVPLLFVFMQIGIAFAVSPFASDIFGPERRVFCRETSNGHLSGSYFVGHIVISSIYRIYISGVHFTAVYAPMLRSVIYFGWLAAINNATFFGMYGTFLLTSMLFEQRMAVYMGLLVSVLLTLVTSGLIPTMATAKLWGVDFIGKAFYQHWLAECFFDQSVSLYRDVYDISATISNFGYHTDQSSPDLKYALAALSFLILLSYPFMILIPIIFHHHA